MSIRTTCFVTTILVVLMISLVASSSGYNWVNLVNVLEEKALNTAIEGDSYVDPGDYTLKLNDIIVGLWKRIYGYGYVNVTSNGIIVKTAFSKASMGMAGVYVKFLEEPSFFNANLTLSIVEDYGGVIEVVLHRTWNNGTGGDKPGSPLAQIIVFPKYGLALIGNTQKSIGKTRVVNIEIVYENNTCTLTVNGFTEKLNTTISPVYVTLAALSTDPGLNITFLLEDFNLTYTVKHHAASLEYSNNTSTIPKPETDTVLNHTTSSNTTHTCRTNTIEVESVSFATNTSNTSTSSTVAYTQALETTGAIISNATITIVYPNGTTVTSIVPVTRKPVSEASIVQPLETSFNTVLTNNIEDRVFNTTFYMIMLVAVIVVALASLVFSKRTR